MSAPPSRGRPLRADAARNRQALVAAAGDAFTKHGVSASLDDVARAAGVGPGTLYRHFPTRDQLVLAVIDDGLRGLCEYGESLLAEPDPVAALRNWLDAYIRQGSVYDGLAATLVDVAPGGDAMSSCHLARAAGAQLIRRAADHRQIDPDTDVDDVLDMAAAIAWVGRRRDQDVGRCERLLTLLFDGLRVTDGTGMPGQPGTGAR